MPKPKLEIQSTTLWEYPSQNYGKTPQGNQDYVGATPSYVIWNCLQRYTKEKDLVVDPMCGSGTTLDVCTDLNRKGLGFDLAPFRPDIQYCDARNLPIKNNTVDLVFLDPPYSTHVDYSEHKNCIGKLDSRGPDYYREMEKVILEAHRILKPKATFALYVSDSFKKGKPFSAIGFELFQRATKRFEPLDIISVVRHNKSLKRSHWNSEAVRGNYFLRGFNYLFLFKKP